MYYDGTSPFASEFSGSYNSYDEIAIGNTALPYGHNGFYTQGYHVVWPFGCWPPWDTTLTVTGTVYIG